MTEFKIERADHVQVGDIVTAPVGNDAYPRDVHWIGKVIEITKPHEEITEFYVKLLAHCDGEKGGARLGVRNERKVGILRIGK